MDGILLGWICPIRPFCCSDADFAWKKWKTAWKLDRPSAADTAYLGLQPSSVADVLLLWQDSKSASKSRFCVRRMEGLRSIIDRVRNPRKTVRARDDTNILSTLENFPMLRCSELHHPRKRYIEVNQAPSLRSNPPAAQLSIFPRCSIVAVISTRPSTHPL